MATAWSVHCRGGAGPRLRDRQPSSTTGAVISHRSGKSIAAAAGGVALAVGVCSGHGAVGNFSEIPPGSSRSKSSSRLRAATTVRVVDATRGMGSCSSSNSNRHSSGVLCGASGSERSQHVCDRSGLDQARRHGDPEEGYFEEERGRYGPVFPRTPACYGFTIIAKVIPGREEAIREHGENYSGRRREGSDGSQTR